MPSGFMPSSRETPQGSRTAGLLARAGAGAPPPPRMPPPGRPPRARRSPASFRRRSACRLCWAGDTPNRKDLSKDNRLKEKIAYCLNLDVSSDRADYPNTICDSCFKNVNKFFKYKLQCERANAQLKEIFSEQEDKEIKLDADSFAFDCEVDIKTEPPDNFPDSLSDSLDDEPLLNLKHQTCKMETSKIDSNGIDIQQNKIEEPTHKVNVQKARKTLKNGIKSKHLANKRKSPTYCNICRSEFGSDFAEHMKAAHGVEESGFKCFGCEKLFRTRKSRLAHEINFCKGLKEGYRCVPCARFLPSRGAYEAHTREHRAGRADLPDDLFKCVPCDKLFKTRANLQQHMTMHKETKNFVCEICGRVFNRQDYLRKHILTHTGQKHYVCPHCGFRATQKSSLTVHIRKHTGERPFSCDICHLKCISSSNLLAHRRRHDGLKKFECSLCGKKFGYKLSLEEHMASTHERLKTHCCKLCGATYTRQRGLKRHARVKHGAEYSKVVQASGEDGFVKSNGQQHLCEKQNLSLEQLKNDNLEEFNRGSVFERGASDRTGIFKEFEQKIGPREIFDGFEQRSTE